MDVWGVHPDFWQRQEGVKYVRARQRAEWLARVLVDIADSELAPEALRLAVGLYPPGVAVRVDGTAIAWIGSEPDDADLWAELPPDVPVPMDASDGAAVAA